MELWGKARLKGFTVTASGGLDWGVGQRLWFFITCLRFFYLLGFFFFLCHHMDYVDQNVFLKEKSCKSEDFDF